MNTLKEELDSLTQLHALAESEGMDLWRFTNRMSFSVKKFRNCEDEELKLAYAKIWLKRFELSVRISDGAGLPSAETLVCAQQVVFNNPLSRYHLIFYMRET